MTQAIKVKEMKKEWEVFIELEAVLYKIGLTR